VEEGSSSGGRISTPTRPRAVALAGVCAVSSALALAASSRKVAAALLSHSESMSGAQHGAQPPPPKGPPPSAVSQAEDTISVALVGASPVVLDGTYMGSMNVLRDPQYVEGINKAQELRRDGILSEKEFVAEKEGLAKQAREKQVQPAADGAHYPAAGASSQEDFRTHPGAPGWRQYTQADGSSYFWNVNTEKLQYPVPPGIPVADFLRSVPRACTPAHRGEHAAAAPILRLLRCIPCTRAKPRAPGQEMFF
jgi:hypothetical protein